MMAATTQGSSNGVSCPHCNKLSFSINHPTKYNWSESWKCTDEACPLGIFYSCRDCYRNNKLNATAKFFSNKKSLYGHHRTKHSSSPPPPKQARVSIEHEEGTSSHFHADDDEAMTYPSESSPSSPSPFASQAILTEHLGSYFERSESSRFYEHERESPGRGYRKIIANALYPEQPKYVDLLREVDVDLHLDITILLDDLPKQHHKRLFDVLRRAEANGKLSQVAADEASQNGNSSATVESVSPSPSPCIARLPDFSEMEHVYLGKNSKISIVANLPHPKVKTLGSHAYIPLREALRDLFAYPHTLLDSPTSTSNTGTNTSPTAGHTPTTTGTTPPPRFRVVYVEKLSQSKAGRDFIQSCRDKYGFEVVEVYIIKWSDGCDPFNVKNNRCSHWILSMSLSPPDCKFYSTDNTYVIAAGPSNESHMPVVDKIREEYEEMAASVDSDLFYYAAKSTFVHVSLGYLAVIQDSPERTGDNCVPAGNGRLNARFGMSVDYQSVWKKIVPCDACRPQFLGNYTPNSTSKGCTKCTSWAIDPSQELLAFKPLKGYPKGEYPENGLLPVLQFTFPKLLEAFHYSYTKLFKREWKAHVYFAYIAYHGICSKTGEEVLLEVRKKWDVKDILESDNSMDEKERLLMAIGESKMLGYSEDSLQDYYAKSPPHPPTWVSGYSFDCLTPSVMHNLFLNVAKNVLKKMSELLKLFNLNEKFRKFAIEATTKLSKVNCSWLTVISWQFKGGYVSENWLGLVHVMKYFTSGAVLLLRDYQYIEPARDKNKWNVKEKQQYLSVRGIKVKPADPKRKDPLKTDVDPVFYAEVNKPGGPSPLLLEPGFENKLTNLVSSYGGLVGCVMTKRTEEGVTSKECEWRVKQFLTFVHEFQLSVDYFSAAKKPKVYEPVWVKQFSYLNLLNLPGALDRWGSMRNLWEGGIIGEGILRSVKPLAARYANHRFELLVTRFYIARALLRAKQRNILKQEEKFMGHEWMKEMTVYTKMQQIQNIYLAHEPIVLARFQEKGEAALQSNKGIRFAIIMKDCDAGENSSFPYVACSIRRTHFRVTISACSYFDWLIDKYEVAAVDTSSYVFTHVILLTPAPKEFLIPLSGNGKPYYAVTSTYDEMIRDGSIQRKGPI